MYSRCTHCQSVQTISAEKLRAGRGLLNCSDCGKPYDALVFISENAEIQIKAKNNADRLPIGIEEKSNVKNWRLLSFLSLLLLMVQFFYFEAGAIGRQTDLRAGLISLCDLFKCKLPDYKNLDEWSVSESDLRSLSSGRYVFSAILTNQSVFPQVCPDIKLVLQNFNGQVVAERVFLAQQYSSVSSLAANESTAVSLTIVAPAESANIGGYSFALL